VAALFADQAPALSMVMVPVLTTVQVEAMSIRGVAATWPSRIVRA
jgi:hypothetical protein